MKRRVFIFILILLFITVSSFISSKTLAVTELIKERKVAIIIDDFGGNVKGVDDFLKAEIPITVAIMPFLEHSAEQAELAHSKGFEVMIHLPLQPKKGKTSWLGPKPITNDLPLAEVKKRVEEAIESVPHAKGMNNHMGSLIVENEAIMRVILETAKQHNLYFIDSGTTPKSVIPKLAEELGIPWAIRDTFLDDTMSSSEHVNKQMQKLLKIAEKNGQAIGIGHVGVKGEATVKGVKKSIEEYNRKKVEIVPVSYLLQTNIDKKPGDFWQE